MRIRRVLVEGLFGLFDHDIPLHSDERVTIMLGPNGYGKTIVLRMLDGFLNGRFDIFFRVPFRAFMVTFDDDHEIRIEPASGDECPPSTSRLDRIRQEQFSGRKPPGCLRVTSSKEKDSQPLLPFGDMVVHFGETAVPLLSMERKPRFRRPARDPIPKWMRTLQDSIHVELIETQRLDITDEEYPTDDGYHARVVRYSEDLASRIGSLLARYASRSQELDRTFPARLLEKSPPPPAASELQDKLDKLEEKRTHLTELGFLDPEERGPLPVSRAVEGKRDVLAVYVVDMEKKLAVFDDMAAKLELLTGIINDLFLYKRLRINQQQGFEFISDTGERIEPDDLSSGEQHLLILLYEFLFHSEPGSLVLIDEPEISLHVTWQERFLDDLMKMVKLSDFDVLVATHSPEIIGAHWNLAVELRGPKDGKRGPRKEREERNTAILHRDVRDAPEARAS